MGKSLVIRGADFSSVSVDNVELSPETTHVWEEITGTITFTNNKSVIYSNGSEGTSTFAKCTNYIDVSRYSKIKSVQPKYRVGPIADNFMALCFYNSSKQFVSAIYYSLTDVEGVPGTEIVEHDVPDQVQYVRTNYWLDSYMKQYPTGEYLPFQFWGLE